MAKYTLLTNLQVAGDFVARSATIGRMEKLLPLGEVCGDAPSGESVTMGGVPGGCVITRVVCVVRNSFASDTKLELGTGAEPSCIAGADDIRCTVPGAYQKNLWLETGLYGITLKSRLTGPGGPGSADFYVFYVSI